MGWLIAGSLALLLYFCITKVGGRIATEKALIKQWKSAAEIFENRHDIFCHCLMARFPETRAIHHMQAKTFKQACELLQRNKSDLSIYNIVNLVYISMIIDGHDDVNPKKDPENPLKTFTTITKELKEYPEWWLHATYANIDNANEILMYATKLLKGESLSPVHTNDNNEFSMQRLAILVYQISDSMCASILDAIPSRQVPYLSIAQEMITYYGIVSLSILFGSNFNTSGEFIRKLANEAFSCYIAQKHADLIDADGDALTADTIKPYRLRFIEVYNKCINILSRKIPNRENNFRLTVCDHMLYDLGGPSVLSENVIIRIFPIFSKWHRIATEEFRDLLVYSKDKPFHFGDNSATSTNNTNSFTTAQPEQPSVRNERNEGRIIKRVIIFMIIACIAMGIGALIQDASTEKNLSVSSTPKPTAASTFRFTPQPTISLPIYIFSENGTCSIYSSWQPEAPFIISVPYDYNYYYVMLRDAYTNAKVATICVHSGKTVEVEVPLGDYTLYYCGGDTWYGPNHLFGEEGMYAKSDDILSFYADGEYIFYQEVTLYPVANGNMDTTDLDYDNFPT